MHKVGESRSRDKALKLESNPRGEVLARDRITSAGVGSFLPGDRRNRANDKARRPRQILGGE